MKSLLTSILTIFIMFNLSACSSAKVRVSAKNQPNITSEKFSGALVTLHQETLSDIEDDSEFSDLATSIIKDLNHELKGMGVSTNFGMTVEILIQEYDIADSIDFGGTSLVKADVFFYNKEHNLMSTLYIQAYNKMGVSESLYGEKAEEALVKEVIKYMKQNYLITQ